MTLMCLSLYRFFSYPRVTFCVILILESKDNRSLKPFVVRHSIPNHLIHLIILSRHLMIRNRSHGCASEGRFFTVLTCIASKPFLSHLTCTIHDKGVGLNVLISTINYRISRTQFAMCCALNLILTR